MNKIFLNAAAAAATILAASAAPATNRGSNSQRLGPREPGRRPTLPSPAASDRHGADPNWPGRTMPGNPPEFGNPGWDPYGLSDTTHPWWNIEGGQVTMNGPGNALTIVWGSPNDNNPAATNTVSFYTGANGTGSLIGQVLASDIYSNFSHINNTQDPGFLDLFLVAVRSSAALCSRPARATSSSPSRFPSRQPGPCWARLRRPRARWIQALAAGSSRARARLIHPAHPSSDRPPRGLGGLFVGRRAKACPDAAYASLETLDSPAEGRLQALD